MDLCGFTNIEMVVFDKDGTLIDLHTFWSEVIRRRAEALVRYFDLPQKEHSTDVLSDIMGLDCKIGRLKEKGPVGIYGRDAVIEAVVVGLDGVFGLHSNSDVVAGIFDRVHEEFAPVMTAFINLLPNVKSFLNMIYRKAKIVLLTSDGRSSAVTALTHTGIIDFFDIVIAREDCSKPKRTGQPLAALLDSEKIRPENVLVVGDAMMDYEMAHNAGVPNVLLVATGQTSAAEFNRFFGMA